MKNALLDHMASQRQRQFDSNSAYMYLGAFVAALTGLFMLVFDLGWYAMAAYTAFNGFQVVRYYRRAFRSRSSLE